MISVFIAFCLSCFLAFLYWNEGNDIGFDQYFIFFVFVFFGPFSLLFFVFCVGIIFFIYIACIVDIKYNISEKFIIKGKGEIK